MRDLIERFYARAWNSWDDAAVTSLLDERLSSGARWETRSPAGTVSAATVTRSGPRSLTSTTRSWTWSLKVTVPRSACGTPAITAGASSDSRPPAPS